MARTSNEFGRRQGRAVTRDTLRAIQGGEPEGFFSSPLWLQARGILIGLLVLALFGGAYLVTTKGFGGRFDPNIKQYLSSGEEPRNVVRDVLLDQVQSACKSRRGDANPLDDIARSANYVACLAGERPKRLCQVAHRVHLLAAMKDYYRLRSKSDPRMVEAFKSLVDNGYVPRRDLVAAAGQSDLDTMLAGAEPKRAGCSA